MSRLCNQQSGVDMQNANIDTRQDLREYSDDELSLWVFNDEGLYSMRRYFFNQPEMLKQYFIFTDEQLDVLMDDLKSDLE